METEMIGMKPTDAIKLKEFLQSPERVILQKKYFLGMGCIDTCYNLVKNTMTSGTEQLIGYGLRLVSYRLREIVENPGNRVMYYLTGRPE